MALFSKRHYDFLPARCASAAASAAAYGPGYQSATRDFILDLADALARDNLQFDRERFLIAVGLRSAPATTPEAHS